MFKFILVWKWAQDATKNYFYFFSSLGDSGVEERKFQQLVRSGHVLRRCHAHWHTNTSKYSSFMQISKYPFNPSKFIFEQILNLVQNDANKHTFKINLLFGIKPIF